MTTLTHHALAEQELLAESEDGYPVMELLAADLPRSVVLATLASWVAQLGRYIADLPQADTDELIQLRERMLTSRTRLQTVLTRLQNSAPACAGLSGRALADADAGLRPAHAG
jgi:hypothetical protein